MPSVGRRAGSSKVVHDSRRNPLPRVPALGHFEEGGDHVVVRIRAAIWLVLLGGSALAAADAPADQHTRRLARERQRRLLRSPRARSDVPVPRRTRGPGLARDLLRSVDPVGDIGVVQSLMRWGGGSLDIRADAHFAGVRQRDEFRLVT